MATEHQDSAALHDKSMMNRVKYFSETIFNVPHPELLPPEAFSHEKVMRQLVISRRWVSLWLL
ncbi:hypothetical protein [Endozoicomonas sp. ALC020]|uniref:hypothetical protein n=1 Tax=unclassified Endozoicomonas TaxID=2644528 RepID=UPI003BB02A40